MEALPRVNANGRAPANTPGALPFLTTLAASLLPEGVGVANRDLLLNLSDGQASLDQTQIQSFKGS